MSEPSLLKQLENTWHGTIPVSAFMGIRPLAFDGTEFRVGAPLAPNINLYQTMFAGSIYTLCTLCGWGMLWLQQQRAGVSGDIVLAQAEIRYRAPVTANPGELIEARVSWPGVSLTPLSEGRRVKVRQEVELWSHGLCCASFLGVYVSQPKQEATLS